MPGGWCLRYRCARWGRRCLAPASQLLLPAADCLGAGARGGGDGGDGAAQLPGQRPRGLRGGAAEICRVLHLGAVLHHAGGRPAQPPPAGAHPRGRYGEALRSRGTDPARVRLLGWVGAAPRWGTWSHWCCRWGCGTGMPPSPGKSHPRGAPSVLLPCGGPVGAEGSSPRVLSLGIFGQCLAPWDISASVTSWTHP